MNYYSSHTIIHSKQIALWLHFHPFIFSNDLLNNNLLQVAFISWYHNVTSVAIYHNENSYFENVEMFPLCGTYSKEMLLSEHSTVSDLPQMSFEMKSLVLMLKIETFKETVLAAEPYQCSKSGQMWGQSLYYPQHHCYIESNIAIDIPKIILHMGVIQQQHLLLILPHLHLILDKNRQNSRLGSMLVMTACCKKNKNTTSTLSRRTTFTERTLDTLRQLNNTNPPAQNSTTETEGSWEQGQVRKVKWHSATRAQKPRPRVSKGLLCQYRQTADTLTFTSLQINICMWALELYTHTHRDYIFVPFP